MRELDGQITSIANKYGVRTHSPINEVQNLQDEQKSFKSEDQGEEQLTIPQFKRLLKEI